MRSTYFEVRQAVSPANASPLVATLGLGTCASPEAAPRFAATRGWFRILTGALVLCALVAVHLFLYSPWHKEPAQGRQYCNFFSVEHGNALEAGGPIAIAPPSIEQGPPPETNLTVIAGCHPSQRACRAPPA